MAKYYEFKKIVGRTILKMYVWSDGEYRLQLYLETFKPNDYVEISKENYIRCKYKSS
jgi:hypothetical protein